MILCSEKAQERINNNLNPTYYQNLKRALKDGERGQTPSHLQSELSCSYMKIIASFSKGIEQQIQKTQELATYFRKKFLNIILNLLPLLHQTQSLRVPEGVSAKRIFQELEHRFEIWICPNGGELSDKVFVSDISGICRKQTTILYSMHLIS